MGEVIYLPRREKPEEDIGVMEALPGLELHNTVEGMSVAERARYKQELLDGINDREKLIWLINRVNEVEQI